MKVHFTGVGGIGMSALARYFLASHHQVSGSDSDTTDLIEELKQEGLEWIPSDKTLGDDLDLHIYTEAVSKNDIQRKDIQKKGVRSLSYFQALGEISKEYKTICVCGTHGKSTVTSMFGIALQEVDEDPLVIVGTKVREFSGKNIRLSKTINTKDTCFVVESCEYRESFLNLSPFGVVLINCEHDHIDAYPTEESYKNAFKKFVKSIPKNGFLVANFDDKNVREVAEVATCHIIPVKFSEIQDPITPLVPGWHNQLNAELVKAAAAQVTEKYVRKSLEQFKGTWRRFDILSEENEIIVIDDYAHHPTEIRVTLNALNIFSRNKKREEGKKVIMFQPHQYSRTRELFAEFIDAFSVLANTSTILCITDIYEARDSNEDKQAVSASLLVEALKDKGVSAVYTGDYTESLEYIQKILQKGDLLVTMGAGPVDEVAHRFIEKSH